MPAQWTSRAPTPLSANDIGRTGMGFQQPFVQGTGIGAAGQGSGLAQFRTSYNPERPYSQVGKMSVNLGNLAGGGEGGAGTQTKGFFQGLGAGGGELLGGVFGEQGKEIGSTIGGAIGGVVGTPFDIVGNALGWIPAVPAFGSAGGAGLMGGKSVLDLPFMDEKERDQILKGWDSNPFSLVKHMSEWNKHEWEAKVNAGEINPLFRDLAPAASIGDQVMQLMGVFGLSSNAVQRTLAGGPLDAVGRIMHTEDANLNPEIAELKQQYIKGDISKDQLLDRLVMANAGYSNDWGLNLLGSMLLDPLLIGGSVAGLAGKTAIAGRLAKAGEFVKMLPKESFDALAKSIETRAAAEGKVISEITGPEILQEAERLGVHRNAIAEAAKQISAKDEFGASIAHLEPIFNAAQNIADPFRMIGRRGSQPVLNAWKTSQAVMGVAHAFNIGNFRKAQAVFDKFGLKDVFNDGMGYFTTQEGMAMEGELLQQDVMATRRVSTARPVDVAEARLRAGSKNYSQRIENFVGRRKADLTRPFGLGTGEAAMARARTQISEKLMKMGLDPDAARRLADDLDADGLSMIDAAYYGHKVKAFNAAKRAGKEANASGHAAAGSAPGIADSVLDRTTLIGSRELTSGRAATLRGTLEDASLTTAEKAAAGREAIRQFDYLNSNFSAVGPTDEEIVTGLIGWLDSFEGDMVKELTKDQMDMLPQAMRDLIDPDDGYILGQRPEGQAEWRIKTDPNDPTKVIATKPWIDTVGDVAQPWNTRFNQNGTKIETMLNALERVMGNMSHQITTEKIFGEARRSFIEKAIGGYSPNQTVALTYEQANQLWGGVLDMAKTLKTSPRGMDMDEFAEVLKKVPAAAAAGITPRDLMGISLHSFEGRMSTVGVTQRISGTAKRVGFEVTGMNGIGRIAERMYPMVRFSMNPFFQIQEWIEPWVFSAARGKKARLTGGWQTVDPVTGQMTKVEPDEVMRMQQQLIDRYAASNPYAQFDQMERSLVFLYGAKAAKSAARKTDVGKLESGRSMLARAMTPHDRKAVAQSEMFRHFLGPILKDQLNSVNPRAWLELEMEYGTTDLGTIAVRYLTEKDVWAAIDPRASNALTEAVKAKQIGAHSRVHLDDVSTHVFKTTRPALTLMIKDGKMTFEDFAARLTDVGAHEDYIANAWKLAKFDVKTGGIDAWWDQALRAPSGKITAQNVKMVRSLVQRWAEVKGVSEEEFVSRTMHGDVLTLMHDDLIDAIDGDLTGWDYFFQTAEDAANYMGTDPVTGLRVPERLTAQQARDRFLSRTQPPPPSELPVEQHGAWNDMQEVQFGADGRSVFIPGGLKALEDTATPWTVWEAHLIRSQMINPNDLKDVMLKGALDEKMWRAHTYDMADPNNAFRLFSNVVMAMTSPQMNLTRNELIASRLRVGSMEELQALAATAKQIRKDIEAAYPPGADIPGGDLGLAYSTAEHMANYVPLDRVDDYAREAYRPEAGQSIKARANIASGYLERANIALHTKIAKAKAKAAADAKEAYAATVKEGKAAAKAAGEKYEAPPKPVPPTEYGRIQEWAIDQAADAIIKASGLEGLRTLPAEMGAKLKVILTGENETYIAAARRLAQDPMDFEARDLIAQLVSPSVGGKPVDEAIIWKPWNINGAGRPHGQGPTGDIAGHGDKPIFAYIKNDDVKWRNIGTNGAIGNALALAEDMVDNPQHYVRRRGPEYVRLPEIPGVATPADEAEKLLYFDDVASDVGYDEIAETAAPNSIQSYDIGTRDWEGAPTITFPEEPDWAAAHEGGTGTRAYGYYDAAGDLAGHVVISLDEAGEATGVLQVRIRADAQRKGVATALYDHATREGLDMRGVTGNWGSTDEGAAFSAAYKGRTAPEGLEPLSELAERISHRTKGLSLKTSYFGVDLGDPMTFDRGVMDTHMVGELTEHMYYELTNKGTDPRWGKWLASLSPEKQKLIGEWLERDWVTVDVLDDAGKPTGTTKQIPWPDKAPRGAGMFDWAEATGLDLVFKPNAKEEAGIKVAVRDGDTTALAQFVRQKIEAAVENGDSKITRAEADRLYRMYRTDAELAELVNRKIAVFGGDYAIYDDLMSEHKVAKSVADPTLARHGNGAYQWKLWDGRRNVWDPEIITFAGSHTLPKRPVKLVAASDDAHGAAGFMAEKGFRHISQTGERFLDPPTTAQFQRTGDKVRGATLFSDPFEKVIALTEHSDASTLVHEVVHALLEPMLDPSGKQIVLDDLNRVITRGNDQVTTKLIYAKKELDDLTQIVIDTQNALLAAQRTAGEATTAARTKVSAATKAEADLAKTEVALAKKTGALEQITKHADARRADINSRKLPPSRRNALLQTVENDLKRAQDSVDSLTSTRDAIRDSIEPLWDEANAAQAVAKSADEDVNIISSTLTRNKAEGVAARKAYDDLITTPPRSGKDIWDREVSEHFADEFSKWLATGKAPSVEMRDVFAYFRRVLTQLKEWVTQENIKVSPEMDELFTKLMTPEQVEAEAFSNPVAFNATQEAMHAAARTAVIDAEDAAFTNVQFRRGRSWMERSLNHPYMGIYPFSYMWGKVMPEMIRALALNPFGMPIPGLVEGATPGLGFLNAQRVWSSVEMQKDTDPEFRKFMGDPRNDKFFRGLSMLSPATPWDMPANYPLYARRLSEWGLEQQDRRATGRQEKGFDAPKVAGEVASYAFGPASSLDWMSDILKWGDAPIIGQGTDSSGAGSARPSSLVIQGPGEAPKTLQQSLKDASGNLQSSLGQ